MSSRVLGARETEGLAAPPWRQAGATAPSPARPNGEEAERERKHAAQLHAQLEELRAGIPMAIEKAKTEGRQAVQSEAARAETALRDEFARRLAATVAELVTVRNQMRRQMEEDLVALAVTVARRVLRRELNVDPEALLGIARAAIAQIEVREIHQLRVAARDAELIRRLLAEQGLPTKINVAGDPSLEAGSLVFETARGTMDASIEVQLAEIDRGLADVLRRSSQT